MKNFGTDYQGLAHSFIYADTNDSGECYGHRMFYNNDVCYSYGYHYAIARKVRLDDFNAVLLINSHTNSVTTNKQRNCVISASSHWTTFYTPSANLDHEENLNHYISEIKSLLSQSVKAKSKKLFYIAEAEHVRTTALSYIETFKVKGFLALRNFFKVSLAEGEGAEKLTAAIKKEADRKDRARRNANKKAIADEQKRISEWRNGSLERVYTTYDNKVYLRVFGDNIQSIKSAEVSIKRAKALYKLIKAKKDVKGFDIDGYTVIGINGVLKIGCHEIDHDQIELIATQLNW